MNSSRTNLPFLNATSSTECSCGCQMLHMGDDISEKLDYEPGHFSVEQHIRSKWACRRCETVVQKPVDAHVIDKGIPTTNLLAQVLIAKYADHQPLYQQQQIYQRAGVDLPRTTLSEWVGRCGSLRSGQRAANVMTLVQSAKINGLDPQRYLKDVLERLPTAKQSDLEGLLPHNWRSRV